MEKEKQLIDVKHLTERIRKKDGIVCATKRSEKIFDLCYTILMHFLETEPTVDAVNVVHGRWEEAGFDGHGDYKECCSNCKSWTIGEDKLYCPVCGAKMDE